MSKGTSINSIFSFPFYLTNAIPTYNISCFTFTLKPNLKTPHIFRALQWNRSLYANLNKYNNIHEVSLPHLTNQKTILHVKIVTAETSIIHNIIRHALVYINVITYSRLFPQL